MSDHYQPCEKRFRTTQYFQDDQLRCSEVAEEFRSVKNLISQARAFDPLRVFQFQTVSVDSPSRR